MFESLEDRQFMSATPPSAPTASVSDGTSNTVMVAEKTTKPSGGGTQQAYLKVTMSDVLIS